MGSEDAEIAILMRHLVNAIRIKAADRYAQRSSLHATNMFAANDLR